MNNYRFFDCIDNPGNPALSYSDNYFYLDGISSKFGFRKYAWVRPGEIEEQPHQPLNGKQIALTILKIVSYLTILLPIIFLIEKLCERSQLEYRLLLPPTAAEQTAAIAYLRNQRTEYDKKIASLQPSNTLSALTVLRADALDEEQSAIDPDHAFPEADILRPLRNPDAIVLPFKPLEPAQPADMDVLLQSIEAAFRSGKKFVVARLGSAKHCIAAAFQADGRFKIIDSQSDDTINIARLTACLNARKIRTPQGKLMRFQGEYVNTNIQDGGNQCIRFSNLYCYRMFITQNLEAYQEVNGAFQKGSLKVFEDYNRIDGASKIKSFAQDSRPVYKPFMQSWAYRACNLHHNDWRGIPLTNLVERTPRQAAREYNEITFIYNNPATMPIRVTDLISDNNDLQWQTGPNRYEMIMGFGELRRKLRPIPFAGNATLGDLEPSKHGNADLTAVCIHQPAGGAPVQHTVYAISRQEVQSLYRGYQRGGRNESIGAEIYPA